MLNQVPGRKKYADNITSLEQAEAIREKAQAEVDKYRESIGLIEDVSVAEPIGRWNCAAKYRCP